MLLRRSATFDDIMAQTSIIGALEKNKIAYSKLNTFVKDLDDRCIENMLKLDHEKLQNQQYVYNLDREIRLNNKNFKKLQEELSHPKPLQDIHRVHNDKSFPELLVNENSFVKHIKFETINKDNYFLPCLIQNLQRQQHYSQINLKDVIEKNKKNSQSLSLKRNPSLNRKSKTTRLTDNSGFLNNNESKSNVQFNENSQISLKVNSNHENQNITKLDNNNQQNEAEISFQKPQKPKLVSDENTLSLNEFKSKHVPRDNLDVIRSVRRERLNPRELNEFYESKMNLLRIGRKFDQYRIKCTKRCEFKHATFMNTYGNNTPRKEYDDDYY